MMIRFIYKTVVLLFSGTMVLFLSGCAEESMDEPETPFAPYVLSLGITSHGTTTYYVVSAEDLMSGTINAVGKGIEQNGYYDYTQGNQTVFCVGGLGVTDVIGITRTSSGYLQEKGNFVFDHKLSEFSQIDDKTMLGVEIPDNPESGSEITFYVVDINTAAITGRKTTSILPLSTFEWPSISGLNFSENKVYMTYFHMNPESYETKYTDTTYVAVFSYPELTLDTIMKDTRTGPAGSWNAFNGIFKTESGDLYIMSNSAMANGYSQSTKNAAFLRIPKGKTQFDDYYFDFETKSGGLKPAHMQYIGNGLIFAEVSTLNPQTLNDRWSDKAVKCCIIDLENQTVTDITDIPVHNGNGGRRFTALVDHGFVYYPLRSSDGVYIYRTDPSTATAERGAKVSATFVGGFFKIN